jgi:cbb3-type cytochrome c oxidase subunit III
MFATGIEKPQTEKKMKRLLMATMLFAACIGFASPSAAADGEALYKSKCLMCHGAGGKGTAMGPAFKDSEMSGPQDQMIAEVILKGREGAAKKHKNIALGMPAQKLSDGDVSALIAYLKSLAGTVAAPAPAPRVNGDNGKKIYDKYCARCHGEDGSGSQYGLNLQPKPTRDLRTNKLFSDNELLIIINHGGAWREMPNWEYVLTDAEVKDAAGYVRALNYAPDPKDGERLFKEKCALCHAADGFMKKTWQAPDLDKSGLGSSEMARIIRYGIHGTLMYPRESVRTNAEISNLVDYIQGLKK